MPGSASPAALDVLVHGAGTVGAVAALALSRQGLAVGVLGAAPGTPRRRDIRAFALNAASVALLSQLKVWDALPADARTAVHEMRVHGDRPGAALEFSAWQQRTAELAWIVDAADLDDALATALRFAPHVHVLDREREAALTVWAEGQRGAAEAQQRLGVAVERQAYGQTAIAARLESSLAHAGSARQWFRSPDVLALLPMDRPRAGHGLALVWSLPDAQAQRLLALPADAFEAELAAACGHEAGTLRLAGERAAWPLAFARAERVHGAGFALVGDAAHVVHPLAGQGLNLGLADVAVLARVLAERESWRPLGDARLLARYARERALPVRQMGQVTDGLLQLFAHPSPLMRELRCRGLAAVDRLPIVKRWLTARALQA
jgi:2-polyprenyl-6-methoxyphenol hydroxylase-like FAD-dependent oxidoreductase